MADILNKVLEEKLVKASLSKIDFEAMAEQLAPNLEKEILSQAKKLIKEDLDLRYDSEIYSILLQYCEKELAKKLGVKYAGE